MIKEILYWLDTNTMNPLAWPYVLIRTFQYRVWPKNTPDEALIKAEPCPVCHSTGEITEQGLCETCGNVIL